MNARDFNALLFRLIRAQNADEDDDIQYEMDDASLLVDDEQWEIICDTLAMAQDPEFITGELPCSTPVGRIPEPPKPEKEVLHPNTKVYVYTGATKEKCWNCPFHADDNRDEFHEPTEHEIAIKNSWDWNFMEDSEVGADLTYWVMNRLDDDTRNHIFRTGSEFLIDIIRLAVKQGVISHKNVFMRYLDENGTVHELKINDEGYYTANPPKGYFSEHMRVMRELTKRS